MFRLIALTYIQVSVDKLTRFSSENSHFALALFFLLCEMHQERMQTHEKIGEYVSQHSPSISKSGMSSMSCPAVFLVVVIIVDRSPTILWHGWQRGIDADKRPCFEFNFWPRFGNGRLTPRPHRVHEA